MSQKLLIVGDSLFAEIAYELFTYDSEYDVVGFAVESGYLTKTEMFGLPVIALEEVEAHFPPTDTHFYAALVYTQLNRLRTRLYQQLKSRGYRAASYISSQAFVWRNVDLGEHIFIFENNVVQPFVTVENNVVLWSGNHIGHHSVIRKNSFISSHVVVSGSCDLGPNGFYGVNCAIGNDVTIGEDCLLGAGCVVTKDLPPNSLIKSTRSEVANFTPRQYFKLESHE